MSLKVILILSLRTYNMVKGDFYIEENGQSRSQCEIEIRKYKPIQYQTKYNWNGRLVLFFIMKTKYQKNKNSSIRKISKGCAFSYYKN